MIRQTVRKLLAAASMTALQVTLLECGVAHAETASAGDAADAGAVGASKAAKSVPNEPRAQGEIAEVLVTAERRSESLQEVPYNISAVSAEELTKSGVISLNSLTQAVAGLQNIDTGPNTRGGNSNFILRGLSTSDVQVGPERRANVATVSTYLDETPIFFPLALKDLDRVEVLKGPQGTLYGSGAEGGTIRLITKRPDFKGFSGYLDAEGSYTDHSPHGNYSLDGALNVPLASNVAVRLAAGYEHLAGFIDAVDLVRHQDPGNPLSPPVSRVPSDPLSGYTLAPVQRGVNDSEQWYVRVAARWQVSDGVNTELSYMHQRTHADALQASNPSYSGGTLNFGFDPIDAQTTAVFNNPNAVNTYRGAGKYLNTTSILAPSTDELDLGNLLITVDLGFATMTSSTSAYSMFTDDTEDGTWNYFPDNGAGGVTNAVVYYAGFPRFQNFQIQKARDEAVTQELRLVSNGNGPFSYVVGGYYQAENLSQSNTIYAPGINAYVPSANPQYGDITFYENYDGNGYRFRDKALFGELTYKITSKWQVTGGARVFWQDFTVLARGYFPWGGAPYSITGTDPSGLSLDVNNTSSIKAHHIGKINTSYDFSPDLKVYATYSEGFRRAGANFVADSGPYASLTKYLTFQPDEAKNYEIGIKGSALDRRLRFTADVFLIDLENAQFNNYSPAGNSVVYNGTTVRSKGAELEADWLASYNLTLRAAYSYIDARMLTGFSIQDYATGGALTQPPTIVTAFSVPAGARMPGVPKNAFNLGADYSIHVGDKSLVTLYADAAYKSDSPGTIDPTSVFYLTLPSSFIANAGVTYNPRANWAVDLFVNNLTNETAYSGAFGPQAIPWVFAGRDVLRPRTFGMRLHYQF
jgi:outer membrane receptor protein involved in Fe transport